MASKNLGAVIQRAISDGAFRRQLQSDPAAALRGFNLTPTEIAAIRSGDAGKLMSLGVDQRMSKAYTAGGAFLGATRSAISDTGTGATSNGIIGDPTSGARDALTSGNLSGTRAVNDVAPFEGNVNAVTDATVSGTRAVNDSAPFDSRSAASTGDLSGTRAVNDSDPFDSRSATSTGDLSGTRAVHDDAPNDIRAAASTGDLSGTRAVQDTPPFEGNVNAAAASPIGDPYSGQYVGVSPEFQANLGRDSAADATRAIHDVAPFGTPGTSAVEDPNSPEFSVANRMADSAPDATRAVQDTPPFDSGIANADAPSDEFISGNFQPGPDSAHNFIPSDSADVQREMLDGLHDGGALGNTGGAGNTES